MFHSLNDEDGILIDCNALPGDVKTGIRQGLKN